MLPTSRLRNTPLLLALIALLAIGFIATSLVSYHSASESIRQHITDTELPLTSDTVYSEIQKDLIRPTLLASMMASDTFLRDWLIDGERDSTEMVHYLQEVQNRYGVTTSFLVSEQSRLYYQSQGVIKQVSPEEVRDLWYFRLQGLDAPYEINVDRDLANQDRLTLFINHRVYDYQGKLLGAAGVGLPLDTLIQLVDRYRAHYQRNVYFTDIAGNLTLTGSQGGPQGAHSGQSLADLDGFASVLEQLPVPGGEQLEGRLQLEDRFLNVRFIPELNWYLFVDKPDRGVLAPLRESLYLSLIIWLLVTALVLSTVALLVRRYQKRISSLAVTDQLTELPNRRGFDLLAGQALQDAQRQQSPLCALLVDLDQFKGLNDSYGHHAGDQALKAFAERLRSSLRSTDIVCRWGGEEFLLLLRETDLHHARQIAEKLRTQAAEHPLPVERELLLVTLSIGVAALQPDDYLAALIGRAERALQRAKQAGRNQVCVDSQAHPLGTP